MANDLIKNLVDHPLAPRNKTQLQVRANIETLEASLYREVEKGTMEQTLFEAGTPEGESQAEHYFGDGVYARSLLIPAGTTVVGKIHQQDRICIIAQGKCTFTDETKKRTVEAPWIGEFKKGSKTAVYAHTDTLWVAVLGTDLKDSTTLIDQLTCNNHQEYHAYLEHEEQRRLT